MIKFHNQISINVRKGTRKKNMTVQKAIIKNQNSTEGPLAWWHFKCILIGEDCKKI